MYAAPFAYSAPETVDEVLTLLARHGDDAKLVAGGQSLLPMMKLRLVRPAYLVDLRRIRRLARIERQGDWFALGAMTTYASLAASSELRDVLPIVIDAASRVGDPQVRNRGTIGGSLAHADPAADMPAVMLVVGAQMVVVGPGGERTIPAEDFFVGVLASSLAANEVLTEIRIPVPAARTGAAYAKCPHPASRFALVGIAASITFDADQKTVSDARIAATGVGPRAIRLTAAEESLVGNVPTADATHRAASLAANATDPAPDLQGDTTYRRNLVRVYTERAIGAALERS